MNSKASVPRSILHIASSVAVYAVVRVLSFLVIVLMFSLMEHLRLSFILNYLLRITHGGFNLLLVFLEYVVALEAARFICSRIFKKNERSFYASFRIFLQIYLIALPVLLFLSFVLHGMEYGFSCILNCLMAFFAWLSVSGDVSKLIKKMDDNLADPSAPSPVVPQHEGTYNHYL